jgi:hypothetical protein
VSTLAVVCGRCGFTLPKDVEECVVCAVLDEHRAAEGCACASPVPHRMYLSRWLCAGCGRLMDGEIGDPVFFP